jgi:hypothetical protein
MIFIPHNKMPYKISLPRRTWFVTVMASTSKVLESNIEDITSIHAGLIEEVHDVPMTVLIRPFPLEVDEDKVHSIMKTLQVRCVVFHYVLLVGNFE